MRKIPVTVTVIMSRVFHLCSKFFLGNNEAHRQRYLKEILTVEYFTDMDLHSANYFLGIYIMKRKFTWMPGKLPVTQKFLNQFF